MPQEFLIAVGAGLGGMLGWGLSDFFAKKTIDRIGDTVSLAWGHIFGTLALILMVLYRVFAQDVAFTWPQGMNPWLLVIIFGIGQAAVYLFVYKGFGKGQVGVLNPIFASFTGITAILSILIFKEPVNLFMIVGLIIIFIGVILLSVDLKALRARQISFAHVPGFKEVIIATFLAAIWTLLWDKVVGGKDWLSYTLCMYAIMTVAIIAYAKLMKIKLALTNPGKAIWIYLFLIGFCEVIAYLAISLGYSSTTYTSIIAVLSGAFSLPVIVLARIFLKEKITRAQTIGSIVVILGIVFLFLI
ncbi:MAG: EamA family transporter [Patescibacteria group bacterium]